MICGGHVGRAHRKQLEARTLMKEFTDKMKARYRERYPTVNSVHCHCSRHSVGCGCLSESFISKAHTSILMECESQEEFVSLPKHARDEHEWEGGRCDFDPLKVCTCKKCEDKESLECAGKPYHTRIKLSCPFHVLAYEIECNERAACVSKILHPVLK